MNFRTIEDLNKLIYNNINKIPNDVDLIVGIPRSGILPATILSLYLNLPLTDIESLTDGKILSCGITKKKPSWIKNIDEARTILIVEDSSSTGNSLLDAKKKLSSLPFFDKIIFLTIYVTDATKSLTDLYFEICEGPRMFEWNYLHHTRLDRVCFDIDGVLCVDPSESENDDGELYKNFIRNAPVRVVPTFKIGYLITSRLEKYREDTEFWLKKNGIKYDKLIMMQFSSKEERLKSGSHGTFKGENYKKIKNSYLFVESDAKQAEEIAKISGKTVFCTENQKIYEESSLSRTKQEFKTKIKEIIPYNTRQLLKKIIR